MFGLGFGARRRGIRRFVDGGTREVNRPLRLIAVSTAALLTVTLAPAEAIAGRGNPARSDVELPELQKDKPVPGADSTDTFQLPVAPGTQIEYAPTRITPIDGGTDQIVLGGGGAQAQSRTATAPQTAAGSEMQQVASLPLWVGASQSQAPATQSGAQARTATAANTTSAAGTWTVTVPTRAETEAAGIDGVIMKLEPSPDATPVDLKLKYETFEQLYGAGWGSRLRFVQFPECFLTTPEVEGCSDAVDVPSANNGTTNEVTATVAAPEEPAAAPQARGTATAVTASSAGGAVVLAAVGGESGESGDYKATSLQPSGKWTAGGSSGGFSWSYPIDVPPSAAGPKPSVSLDYSSQSVDGRTSTTNNQASWVGDGWDYSPGYIERTYRSCADDKTGSNTTKKTGDLCWGSENAVMSLNGTTVPLVKDNTTGAWKPQSDNGSRVEQKFGSVNGDDNGEYWLVTTPDGTKYHFGLNRLPGWVNGNPTTDSAWTVPVFGNQANEPCHQSSYEASACDQAWRWNLDYVEDTRGNAMAMYWKQEKNWYAKAGKTDQPKPYVRGGWLDRIEYGVRADSVYSKPATAKVSFAVDERCLRKPDFDCSDAKFTKHSTDGLHWPDVPVDSMCKETGKCMVSGPTFWTRKWLTTITTQVATAPGANTYRTVDSFELKHNFLDAQYDTNPPAWLDSIQRTGHAADGAIASLPPITFHANSVAMPNRQTGSGDNRPPFLRLRVAKIFTETGGGITVTYSQPDPICTPGASKPKPEENTSLCYPVFWAPDGDDDPIKVEWFNKYVVKAVSEEDFVGKATPVVTEYRYLEGGAWAKDDDEFSKPNERTWSQWRGFGRLQTVVGKTDPALGTVAALSEQRFFRGMDGDPLPTGSRDVKVRDSTGAVIAEDIPPYQGLAAETITYYADGQAVAFRNLVTPWSRLVAAQTRNGLPQLEAYQSGSSAVTNIESISGGRTRTTRASTEFDATYGLPTRSQNDGDLSVVGDETCTVTSYEHIVQLNVIGLVKRVRSTTGSCVDAETAGPERTVSETRRSFDGQAFETAAVRGSVTRTEDVNGNGVGFTLTSASVYDHLGRTVKVTDADGRDTVTEFLTDGQDPSLTETVVTNPLGHQTTTLFEPGRGLPLSKTDPNGRVTRTSYDALGRLTAVWMPGRSQGGQSPNTKYTYEVSAGRPTVVTSESVRDDGTYVVSKAVFDGLLRPRQNQVEAVGGGRLITDTFYNASGSIRRATDRYLAEGSPVNAVYEPASLTQVRSWTETKYDGLNRAVEVETWHGGGSAAESTTKVQFSGDVTVTIPPRGGIATRVWTDAQGRTVKLDQFTSRVEQFGDVASAQFSRTTYDYDVRGNRVRAQDAAGNVWASSYDVRGRLIQADDPDKGRSAFTYDNSGRQVSSTDARNGTLHTVYDALGRKTQERSGDENGPKLAEWTYDSLAKGLLTSSVRYEAADAYVNEVLGYTTDYQPSSRRIRIPQREGALQGDYVYRYAYTPTGNVAETTLPAGGGLPEERVVTRYNRDGLPVSTTGWAWYTSDTVYGPYGDVLRTQTGSAPARVWTTNRYDEHTGELLDTVNHREASPHAVNSTYYGYDKAGNVTYLKDITYGASGAPSEDVQCFNYDARRMMTDAWTSTNHCATGPQTGGGGTVGGPDPYWRSYAFDAIGNRVGETLHDVSGNTSQDIRRVYGYRPASQGNSHQLTDVTSTGPGGQRLNNYTYDAAGNTASRSEDGNVQELEWRQDGRLGKVEDPVRGDSTFVYDADGNRLLRRTASESTLFLGETEITSGVGGAVSAERYYSHPGAPTVVRTAGSGGVLTALISDIHNTATLAITLQGTMVHQRRKITPFGEDRGAAPQLWPGSRGFVDGIVDSSTGLTHLGAREYDAALGRFISVDPVIDMGDPLQMHPYVYGYNNPLTFSDPDGLWGMPKWAKKAANAVKKAAPVIHVALDVAGMVPVIGEAADLANAAVYAAEGDWTNAALSAAAAIPVAGNAATAGRVADRTVSAVDAATAAGRTADKATDVSKAAPPTKVDRTEGPDIDVDNTQRNETCSVAGNSFAPDTPVLMADGSTRPIADVEVGDAIMAVDPVTGERGGREVVATIDNGTTKPVVEIELAGDGSQAADVDDLTAVPPNTEAGDRGGDAPSRTLTATEGHPFWLPFEGRWADAGELQPGQWLQTSAGTWVQVAQVRPGGSRADVLNLNVEDLHTYFVVAGGAAVLVHNSGGNDCGRVEYGTDELAIQAHIYRYMYQIPFGANIAVVRLKDGTILEPVKNNPQTDEDPGTHSESRIIERLKEKGIPLSEVQTIYTERQPCQWCNAELEHTFQQNKIQVTWSVPYGKGSGFTKAQTTETLKSFYYGMRRSLASAKPRWKRWFKW
ncbi:polymorphic toxin-type HINT domain-containing protein [Streptomycetaceae bacterium NBC_01309]